MARAPDVFAPWREALQKWEQDTNAAITAATGDARFSQAMNQSLALLARAQAKHSEAVEQVLERANLPSRADFRRIDARLDSLEAQIRALTELVKRQAGGVAPASTRATGPARTRKPSSKPAAAEAAAKPAKPKAGSKDGESAS